MVKIEYVIKKNEKYLTEKFGWSKDINKAELLEESRAKYRIKSWDIFENAKIVAIRETYTREEV